MKRFNRNFHSGAFLESGVHSEERPAVKWRKEGKHEHTKHSLRGSLCASARGIRRIPGGTQSGCQSRFRTSVEASLRGQDYGISAEGRRRGDGELHADERHLGKSRGGDQSN